MNQRERIPKKPTPQREPGIYDDRVREPFEHEKDPETQAIQDDYLQKALLSIFGAVADHHKPTNPEKKNR
ncbi:MAG: hypothetical protein V1898_00875 [Patescibacteria group bacterium]